MVYEKLSKFSRVKNKMDRGSFKGRDFYDFFQHFDKSDAKISKYSRAKNMQVQ